jgi:hypothetical protein
LATGIETLAQSKEDEQKFLSLTREQILQELQTGSVALDSLVADMLDPNFKTRPFLDEALIDRMTELVGQEPPPVLAITTWGLRYGTDESTGEEKTSVGSA